MTQTSSAQCKAVELRIEKLKAEFELSSGGLSDLVQESRDWTTCNGAKYDVGQQAEKHLQLESRLRKVTEDLGGCVLQLAESDTRISNVKIAAASRSHQKLYKQHTCMFMNTVLPCSGLSSSHGSCVIFRLDSLEQRVVGIVEQVRLREQAVDATLEAARSEHEILADDIRAEKEKWHERVAEWDSSWSRQREEWVQAVAAEAAERKTLAATLGAMKEGILFQGAHARKMAGQVQTVQTAVHKINQGYDVLQDLAPTLAANARNFADEVQQHLQHLHKVPFSLYK